MAAYQNIKTETKSRVGIIRLDRPKALNALCADLVRELGQALDAFAAATPDLRHRIEHIETPSPSTSLGTKGVGEAGTAGAPAAAGRAGRLPHAAGALSGGAGPHLSGPAGPGRPGLDRCA